MSTPTPATVLRMAEAIPETPETYLMIRELIGALKDLVTIANQTEGKQ